MWPFLNNITTTCEQNYCTPASSICYTGSNLSCIGVNQNDTLSVALQKINAVMCEPISSAKIIEALGYTPANDANVLHTTGDETKNGSLTVNDTGNGVGVKGISVNGSGLYGESNSNTGVSGNSVSGLAGVFNTTTGTKIVSFLSNSIEQAYILATGLFKANKILVNTTTDNGIDVLQVNGTISATAASTSNQVVIKSQLDTKANDTNVVHLNGNETITGQKTFTTDLVVNSITIGRGSGSSFNNTAVGKNTLILNISGNNNTAIGENALDENTSGSGNVAIGTISLGKMDFGSNNIGIGFSALNNNIGGNNNIGIGRLTKTLSTNDFNSIVIGDSTIGLGSNTTVLGNIYTTSTAIYGNLLLGTTVDNGTDKLQVSGSINVSQYKISALNTAPATSTSNGTLGEIRITATHIYVCIATNTWVRTALTTWV